MTPPAHLSPAAQQAWSEITAKMGNGAVDGIEGPALEAYAVAIARQRDAQQRIDSEGIIIAGDKGNPIPHPALAIEKAASAEIRAWVTRYRKNARV